MEPSGFVVVVVVVVEDCVSVVVCVPEGAGAEGFTTVSVGDTEDAGTTAVPTSVALTGTFATVAAGLGATPTPTAVLFDSMLFGSLAGNPLT